MKKNLDILKNLSLLSYVGLSMVIPIVGGLFIGNLIDSKLETGSIFLIVGILLGVAAGYRNVYYIIMKKPKARKDTRK